MTVTTDFPKTRTICESINTLINELNAGNIKPYPAAVKRRNLVIEGLDALGKECLTNLTIEPLGTATGSEILIKADYNGYGESMTKLLNSIPVRHAAKPTKGFVMPVNRWSYVQQNYAEQMLFRAAGMTP